MPPGAETWPRIAQQTTHRGEKVRVDPPIRSFLIPGEPNEAGRADWGNAIAAASHAVGRKDNETVVELLVRKTGMPEDMAKQLVDDARNDVVGTRVTCKTVFEEPGRIGGERHYEGFQIVHGQKVKIREK